MWSVLRGVIVMATMWAVMLTSYFVGTMNDSFTKVVMWAIIWGLLIGVVSVYSYEFVRAIERSHEGKQED